MHTGWKQACVLLISWATGLALWAQPCDKAQADSLYAAIPQAATATTAEALTRQAAAAYWCLGDTARWANCYKYLSRAYAQEGDLGQALAWIDTPLVRGGDHLPPAVAAGLYMFQGNYWVKAGLYAPAATAYEAARSGVMASPPVKSSAGTYILQPLGNAYTRLGDYEKARLRLEEALSAHRAAGAGEGEAATLSDLAVLLRTTGAYAAAADSLRLAMLIPEVSAITGWIIRVNLAEVLAEQKSYAPALALLNGVIRETAEVPHIHAPALAARADIHDNLGDYAQAEADLRTAIATFEADDPTVPHRQLGKTYAALGDLYLDQNPAQALQAYQDGLRWVIQAFAPPSPETIPTRDALFAENTLSTLLAGKGQALHRLAGTRGQPALWDQALAHFDLALAVDSLLESTYLFPSARAAWLDARFDLIGNALAAAFDRWEAAPTPPHLESFYGYSEAGKAALLRAAAAARVARAQASLPPDLQRAGDQLRQNLALLEQQRLFRLESDEDWPIEAQQALQRRREEALEALANWEQTASRYAPGLVWREQAAVPLGQVQARIPAGTALLSFAWAEDALYLLIIDAQQARPLRLAHHEGLEARIRAFREAIYTPYIEDGIDPAPWAARYQQLGYQLYQELIAPLGPDLPPHLVLLPDGPLGYLPFAALLQRPVDGQPEPAYLPYWARAHQLSWAFSASSWYEGESALPLAPQGMLAVAPRYPAMPMQDGAELRRSEYLGPLAYSEAEAREVQRLMGGQLLTGEAAGIASFRDRLTRHRWLHFSGHAKAPATDPDAAFLAFPSDLGDGLPARLYLSDLYSLDLAADLVVLSACETGLGPWQRGEGISSLARGFQLAGARSVVTTLWSVNDQVTARLMGAFYAQLHQGQPKGMALHAAQQALMEANYPPFFWAGYVLTGHAGPVERPFDWRPYLGLLAGILLAGGLYWRWRDRRQQA